MAVLNALRSPAFQAELGIGSSTGSSSPRDSETGYQMASETGSISSSMSGGSHDHHPDMPPPPPPPSWSQSDTMPRDYNVSMNASVVVVSKRIFLILVAATLSVIASLWIDYRAAVWKGELRKSILSLLFKVNFAWHIDLDT